MFKTKRRKELEAKENELYILKSKIQELRQWCAENSGEIAFAALWLEGKTRHNSVSVFRDDLRKGLFTFGNYKEVN